MQTITARVFGAILLVFGIALGALALWVVERQLSSPGTIKLDVAAVVIAFIVLCWFCSTVGYRLTFDRPNQYNSILSPISWLILAVCIGGVGIAVAAINFYFGKYVEGLVVLALGTAFVYRCAKARHSALSKGASPLEPQQSPRPPSMQWAVRLLWLAAALPGFALVSASVRILFGLSHAQWYYLANLPLLIGAAAICALNAGAGRNWARWLLVIVAGLFVWSHVDKLITEPEKLLSEAPSSLIAGAMYEFLLLAAAILMFTASSRAWFKSRRAA